ncbi:TPA_asm: hypothetical protein vir520_00030 [Caudoviricetes sp. vir520]|nr:TPA_asm: hypothetical protein vir520_00030 [Caudoviricetes sp. vir520]
MRKWEWIANRIHEIEKAYTFYQFDQLKRLTPEQKEIRKKAQKILDLYHQCKVIALKFDQFLDKNYKEKITEAWKAYYDMAKASHITDEYTAFHMRNLIFHIALNGAYCTACQYHSIETKLGFTSDCINCKFGKQFGVCDEEESIFQEFRKKLEELEGEMHKF